MSCNEITHIEYNQSHIDIVEKGIDAISEVLIGTNMSEKESLLICLDRYLDPWYGYKLLFKKAVFELLQHIIISPNTKAAKEEALHLLISYSWPPFTILDENLGKIEPDLLPEVQYAITME